MRILHQTHPCPAAAPCSHGAVPHQQHNPAEHQRGPKETQLQMRRVLYPRSKQAKPPSGCALSSASARFTSALCLTAHCSYPKSLLTEPGSGQAVPGSSRVKHPSIQALLPAFIRNSSTFRVSLWITNIACPLFLSTRHETQHQGFPARSFFNQWLLLDKLRVGVCRC